MPATTAPDASGLFEVLLVTHPCTVAECRSALAAAFASPTFLARRALLVDRREADLATVGFVDEMVRFVAAQPGVLVGARAAIVTSNDAAYGMSRMLQLKMEIDNRSGLHLEAFRSYDDAVRWLTAGSQA